MNNPRLVQVKDELGHFRGWEQSDNQTSQTYGIVEFENRIARVKREMITFVDVINVNDVAGYLTNLWSRNKHYILVVKSHANLSQEQLQFIHDCIEVQKKTGIILLPSYLDAQIVPDDIEIKLDKTIKVPLDKNGNEVV